MNTKFEIKRLSNKDILLLEELIVVFKKEFEEKNSEPVKDSYLKNLLSKPDFIVYVVLHEHKVVGGLTAFELPMYYSEGKEVFIYDVAIKKQFQRLGLGKQLLNALKNYCEQHNISNFFVAAHEEDIHALDFYRSSGGNAESVVHFNFGI